MLSNNQKWLVDKLIHCDIADFNDGKEAELLQKKIAGMTAEQILEAMKVANDLKGKLISTSLGKELV